MDNKGWLYKRGKFRQSWKRRYFAVDPIKHTLCYYMSPPEEAVRRGRVVKPLGVIDLTNSTVIVEKDLHSYENCFRVKTHSRDYYISASDPFKMNTWISVLRLNSKLGTLEKSVEKEIPTSRKYSPPEMDEKYSLSFKLAADKMLKSLSDKAQSSRQSLEDTSTTKYEIKLQLKRYLAAIQTQRTESELKLKSLRESESASHQALDSINALIVTLDKFLQASRYLQRHTIAILSLNQNSRTSMRTLREMVTVRKSSEIPKELAKKYLQLLADRFPDTKSPPPFESRLLFYSQYYDKVHLPKLLQLEPAKVHRLDVWRKLVSSVNGIKKTCQQLSELALMEEEIKAAINPSIALRSRPMSMIDPDEADTHKKQKNTPGSLEDIPEEVAQKGNSNQHRSPADSLGLTLYASEWKGILKVIDALSDLRLREKEMSQKLDDALHSRELLASFSSKGKARTLSTASTSRSSLRKMSGESNITEGSNVSLFENKKESVTGLFENNKKDSMVENRRY